MPLFYTDTFGGNPGGYQPYYIPGQQRFGSGSVTGNTGGVIAVPGRGSIEELTQMVNEINRRAQKAANAGRIPGGAALEEQSSANIGNALAGIVDPSVTRNLAQVAAERGAGSGNPLGANTNADYLHALGLTTLDLQNRGQGWLTAAEARNPAAPIYDAGNQVLTAAQIQQAILAREEMNNRLRMAQLGRGGGGGSVNIGRGTTPTVATSASNWMPVFGQDQTLPTPTAWTPTQNPSFSNSFTQSGGTWQPTYGDNPVLPFETDWQSVLFGGNNPGNVSSADQDWLDFENWVFAPGGG